MPKTITGERPELKPINAGAAAIDIGSKMHMAAVDPTCTDTPVRAFGTFTRDLHDLADWFNLKRRAKSLGFVVLPAPGDVEVAVS